MKRNISNQLKKWPEIYGNLSLLKNFTVVFSIDLLVKASAVVLLPVYLRLMTQEEYGSYNYFLSIIQVFTLILNLGLYTSLSKYYHKYTGRKERGSLLFTIGIILVVFLVIFGLLSYIFKIDYWLIGKLFKEISSYAKYRAVVLLSLIVSVLSFMLTNFLYTSEKIQKVKWYNFSRIVLVNAVSIIALWFIRMDHCKGRLLFSALADLLLLVIFGYYAGKELVFRFNKVMMVSSLKMGLPIMVSAILGLVINFSDKYYLEKYGTLRNLSAYFLAFSFANILPLVFTSFQNIWLPVFLKETDPQRNFQKMKKVISRILVVLVVVAVLIWIFLFILIYFKIIQEKYSQALWILPLLLITQIIGPITTIYSNYLIYIEKTYVASLSGLVTGLVSIVLAATLVPKYGVYGSATSILLTYLCYLILYYSWVNLQQRKINSLATA